LRESLRVWSDGAPRGRESVREIRRRFVSDEVMGEIKDRLDELDVTAGEARQVMTTKCSQHGDLHGANVIVNAQSHPYMIDFGRVGTYTAATDPITLELSFIFHPAGRAAAGGWPSPDQADRWADPHAFAGEGG